MGSYNATLRFPNGMGAPCLQVSLEQAAAMRRRTDGQGRNRGSSGPRTTSQLAACVLLLALALPSQADRPSIELAGASIELAMSWADVQKKLGGGYRLIAVEGDGTVWSVEDKTAKAIVGHLEFETGRVIRARRTWGTFSKGDDALHLGHIIVALLSDLRERGSGEIRAVVTGAMAGSKLGMKVVELQFDDRTVKLIEVSGERETIQVDEILEIRD